MKKFFLWAILTMAMCVGVSSCSKDEEIRGDDACQETMRRLIGTWDYEDQLGGGTMTFVSAHPKEDPEWLTPVVYWERSDERKMEGYVTAINMNSRILCMEYKTGDRYYLNLEWLNGEYTKCRLESNTSFVPCTSLPAPLTLTKRK